MGAFSNTDFLSQQLPRQSNDSTPQDRLYLKHIHDNVHGNIYVDPLCLQFIDTPQFQRLRDLKQLGFTHLVFPGAVHSRFEHSLGVYFLADAAVRRIKTFQGLELDIDDSDIQTVQLAGLLHDVGHGPFSHLFEREFLPRVVHGLEWSHEQMSVKMIDYIVDEHSIDVDPDITKRMKEMILASSKTSGFNRPKEKSFLYDIVANGRNGVDVDKFDYIVRDSRACAIGTNFSFERLMETMRVIGDEICYPSKEYLSIYKLFHSRADLYRTVYMHSKVKAIDIMFVEALVKAESHMNISSCIQSPAEYWKLDDTIFKSIEVSTNSELKESRDLILRIRRRDLYQFCNEYAVPKSNLEHFKHVTSQDIICCQKSGGVTLREEDVVVSNVRIDFSRGKSNPLESVKFYKDYRSEKFPISEERISHLLPASCQDRLVRVYATKPELVEATAEAFENFQLKMYGIKAQVHGTPEKKKFRM